MNDELRQPDLLDRARAGEPKALQTLYEEYADELYQLAYMLTDSAADARDVLQEIFVALPEALATYEERAPLRYWLRKITLRAALTRLRWRQSRKEVALSTIRALVSRDDPSAILARLSVDRFVSRLPPRQRVVLVLKQLEGLSHAEIGELLGISPEASRGRLARAMKNLRRMARGERP